MSLCNAFPTLFDLVDKSDVMEVYGVAKNDFMKVVDHCYLCDPCFMTKCPYVPPHPWNVDFPHLMLRTLWGKASSAKRRVVSHGAALGAAYHAPRSGTSATNNVLIIWTIYIPSLCALTLSDVMCGPGWAILTAGQSRWHETCRDRCRCSLILLRRVTLCLNR